jgi:ATP-dependent RNA helicase DeaD
MKFEELGLNKKLVDKTHEEGFTDLTPIQEKCIPEIMLGNDVVGQAETGSGKTLAFCLPILEKITPGQGLQVLVLTPTRELCVQITTVFKHFGTGLGLHTTSIYGGVGIQPQIKKIRTSEIVVGTPGRILDHLGRKTIDFWQIHILVLDETDKMFEMGFIDDVEDIIQHVPKKRQTLMFSATISNTMLDIMEKHLNRPRIVKTQSYVDHRKLHQVYYDIHHRNNKFSLLVHLLKNHTSGLAIVFCATRRESDAVAKNLVHQGIDATAIHGGMSQQQRLQSLESLRKQRTQVLVATDVAARGLDIKNVTHIYNYDVPKTPKEYIHRIGRTARAGSKGAAITLLTEPDHDNFRRVQSNEDLQIKKAYFPRFIKVPFFRTRKRREKPFPSKQRHSYRR